MTKDRGNGLVYLRKNLPTQEEFVDFIRSVTTIDEIEANTDIPRTKIEHWFRRDKSGFSYPTVEDWEKFAVLCRDNKKFDIINKQITDVTVETDDINKNSNLGRINGYHYAPFPEQLVETPILACSKDGDTVMDIFMGSGTVGVVCKRLKRNFIGIELNKEYIKLAEERIANGYWEEKTVDKKVQKKLF